MASGFISGCVFKRREGADLIISHLFADDCVCEASEETDFVLKLGFVLV